MKYIILDRDGVINIDSDNYIRRPEEWHPIPGSLEAIAKLYQAGYTIVVATNQSGLERGYFTQETLDAIHQKMLSMVSKAGGHIEHIFFCPHSPDTHCVCRKPKPGLVHQFESIYGVSCEKITPPFVGDSLRDLQAAVASGCQPILVKTGKGLATLEKLVDWKHQAVAVYENLLQFTEALLEPPSN